MFLQIKIVCYGLCAIGVASIIEIVCYGLWLRVASMF
jgi:hypothetical protein